VDYYGALNVTTGSNTSEIKSKYRRLALQYHPDKLVGMPKKQQKVCRRSTQFTADLLTLTNIPSF
jgi:DnaJ-class molecular chaperone